MYTVYTYTICMFMENEIIKNNIGKKSIFSPIHAIDKHG